MALKDSAAMVQDFQFSQIVQAAMTTAAIQISGEAVNATYQAYHDKRAALAQTVLTSPEARQQAFIRVASVNATIVAAYAAGVAAGLAQPANNIIDQDLQFVVNASWDDIAGVVASEVPPVEVSPAA